MTSSAEIEEKIPHQQHHREEEAEKQTTNTTEFMFLPLKPHPHLINTFKVNTNNNNSFIYIQMFWGDQW